MLVQMGKFVNIGLEMLTTEKEIKKDTGMMLEKQDETIGAIREVSENIDVYFYQ